MILTDIKTIKDILKQERIWPDKRSGQNFLIDRIVLMKIVDTAQIKSDDMVVEIGPGLGVLTQEMVKKAGLVLAIEKDRALVEWLRRYFKSQSDKVKVVCEDILQYDLSKLIQKDYPFVPGRPSHPTPPILINHHRMAGTGASQNDNPSEFYDSSYKLQVTSYKIISNLPYNITSPVIRKFIESKNPPTEMVLMVQKEVAERICAKPGNRERGLLTIIIEYFGKAEIIEIVPRTCFYPEPDVDSAIIKICNKKRVASSDVSDYKTFLSTTKVGFSQKRRQIHHPLKSGLHLSKDEVYDILKKANIAPELRAEDISLEGWIELARQIQKKVASS